MEGNGSGPDRTAFVLTGGGSLGAVQVGMLYALLEAGVRPDLVVGSSVGALNGAYLAGHPSLEGVEALAGLWESIKRTEIFPISPRRMVAGALGWRNHLFDPLGLRTLILRADLGFDRLEDAPVPLHAMATDVSTGTPVVLSRGDVIDALMASAAMPGAFPPVEVDGRALIDGSVTADAPVEQAEQLGGTSIYLLSTSAQDETAPRGALDMVQRAIELALRQSESGRRAEVSSRVPLHVVPAPPRAGHSVFDFGRTTELIDSGYHQTAAWLAGDLSQLVA
ncbi:MAG: patatin-like phospholipase family protein [Actinobacteria bacterium]|nr:MAG: patatin-like phospholipase family protein [Actinomycetota bacterium]